MNENEVLTVDEVLDTGAQTDTVEVVEVETYDFLTKPFDEYTQTEGLLLLCALFVFFGFSFMLIDMFTWRRRW